MRDYLQLIGTMLRAQCPQKVQRVLLHSEVDDGFTSTGVYFSSSRQKLVFRDAQDRLDNLVYRFWKNGQGRILPRSWAAMEYMIIGEKFDVAFTYPEDFESDEAPWDRRDRVLARRFPGYSLGTSNPES